MFNFLIFLLASPSISEFVFLLTSIDAELFKHNI